MRWFVLEEDAKLYEIVKSLIFEYGEEVKWLIPYPGVTSDEFPESSHEALF